MASKCAPKFAGDTVSCFTRDALLDIVDAYNRNHGDPIKISSHANKTQIWRTIQDRMQKNCGDDETCWLQQPFLSKKTRKLNLEQYFKPLAPLGRYQWLTTEDIYKVMAQWDDKYPHFRFVGPLPMDFMKLHDDESRYLQRLNLRRCPHKLIGAIFNMDPSTKSGSHWVALAIDRDNREINFFDSYGDRFPAENKFGLPFSDSQGRFQGNASVMSVPVGVQKFIYELLKKSKVGAGGGGSERGGSERGGSERGGSERGGFGRGGFGRGESGSGTNNRSAYQIKVNNVQHQYANSECGIYSMLFLIKSLRGESFEAITNDIVLDEQANQLRDWFFRRS